ncbi:MAG: FMN-binding glutamate synthase family protein [Clostridiales bacterium]|nr:FMN-binding glutamate synthase family protein [Clostridiales bacterium]
MKPTSMNSAFGNTRNRSPYLAASSGMCSLCAEDCDSLCELGLAAVRGAQTVYPTTTGANQVASEKQYPLDFSAFNINGRVFGALGAAADAEQAGIFSVGLGVEYGQRHPVKLAMPIILPALIKLNWRDYFGGAAMAGVTCMVGEDAKSKDPGLRVENGRITDFPFLGDILDSFARYDRGYGQIVPQCNVEDDLLGVPEIAVQKYGARAIEFKFGQAAKGTQPANRLPDLKTALARQQLGGLVRPDPSDPEVQRAWEEGVCPNFYLYGRLPMWDEDFFARRLAGLRALGLQNVYFKMAGYDPADMERVLRIACAQQVDMVTFDCAGGGSGYSPCKMMNEWGRPAVLLERQLLDILNRLQAEGLALPAVSIAGGFASEDQVFKALAFGNGQVKAVGLCRAPMAAAMRGASVGAAVRSGHVPAQLAAYGSTVEELFADLPDLRALYGKAANDFSPGAIGVFSYLNKIAFGLRHFAALNRKFDVGYLDRSDLVPLTAEAATLL